MADEASRFLIEIIVSAQSKIDPVLKKVQSQVDGLSERLKVANVNAKGLGTRLDSLDAKMIALNKSARGAAGGLDKLAGNLGKLNAGMASLVKLTETLENRLQKLDKKMVELGSRTAAPKVKLENEEDTQRKIDRLLLKLEALDKRKFNARIGLQTDALDREIAEVEAKIEKLGGGDQLIEFQLALEDRSVAVVDSKLEAITKKKEVPVVIKTDNVEIDRLLAKLERLRTQHFNARVGVDKRVINQDIIETEAKLLVLGAKQHLIKFRVELAERDKARMLKINEEANFVARRRELDIVVNTKSAESGFKRIDEFGQKFTGNNPLSGLSTRIRDITIAFVALFAEPIISGATALAGAFVAVGIAAGQAAAGVAGLATTLVAEALPVFGLFAVVLFRVAAVLKAVFAAQNQQAKGGVQGKNIANQQANAAAALARAHEGVTKAILAVTRAQEALNKARQDGLRTLQDMRLEEQQANLTAQQSKIAFAAQTALGTGGLGQADLLQVRSDQINARRSTVDTNAAVRGGVNNLPAVQSAKQNLDDARQAVDDAKRSVKEAERQFDFSADKMGNASNTLAQDLAKLTPAEKQLFRVIRSLLSLFQKGGAFSKITDIIISSFSDALGFVIQLLKDPKVLEAFTNLANSIGKIVRSMAKFFTTGEMRSALEFFANLASKNLKPISKIFEDFASLFVSVARAASGPLTKVLDAIVKFMDNLAKRASSKAGQKGLADFFNAALKPMEAFVKLGGAIIQLFLALAGPGGATKAGTDAVNALTDTINRATGYVKTHGKEVQKFFEDSIKAAGIVGKLLIDIGGAILDVFDPKTVQEFADFLTRVLLPIFTDLIKLTGTFLSLFSRIFSNDFGRVLAEMGAIFILGHKILGLFVFATSGIAKLLLALKLSAGFAKDLVKSPMTIVHKLFGGAAGERGATPANPLFVKDVNPLGGTSTPLGKGAKAAEGAAVGGAEAGAAEEAGASFSKRFAAGALKAVKIGAFPVALATAFFSNTASTESAATDDPKNIKAGIQRRQREARLGSQFLPDISHIDRTTGSKPFEFSNLSGGLSNIKKQVDDGAKALQHYQDVVNSVGNDISKLSPAQIDDLLGTIHRLDKDGAPDLEHVADKLKAIKDAAKLAQDSAKHMAFIMKKAFDELSPVSGEVLDGFRDIEKGGGDILGRIADNVKSNISTIAHDLGEGSKKGRQALAANFIGAAEAIQRGVQAGTISAAQGANAINKIMHQTGVDTAKGIAEVGNLLAHALKALGEPDAVIKALKLNPIGDLQQFQSLQTTATQGNTTSAGAGSAGALALLARGGPVPGYGNKDTQPAMLTPGEHVWTKDEVAKAGGHGAMYAMRNWFGGGGQGQGGMYAKGGAVNFNGQPEGVTPAIRALIGFIESKFPKMVPTSTSGSSHNRLTTTGNVSYHASGRAVDMNAGSDWGYMNRVASWINTSGFFRKLTEGIHNPGYSTAYPTTGALSVKNGAPTVPYGEAYWDAGSDPNVWAEHLNHIHMAIAGSIGSLKDFGGPAVVAAGKAASKIVDHTVRKLKEVKTKGKGITGSLSQSAINYVDKAANALLMKKAHFEGGGGATNKTPGGPPPSYSPSPGGTARKGKAGTRKTIPANLEKYNKQYGYDSTTQISPSAVYSIANWAGLPPAEFVKIAKGESSYEPGAIGDDYAAGYGHTFGYGLWQITTKYSDSDVKYASGTNNYNTMLNPLLNGIAAKHKYENAASKDPNSPYFPWRGTKFLGTGGAVGGYGNSDTQPAMLTAGEHVWTKEEVNAAGGHGAMLAMRRMFGGGGTSSGGAYAAGGPVHHVRSDSGSTYADGVYKTVTALTDALATIELNFGGGGSVPKLISAIKSAANKIGSVGNKGGKSLSLLVKELDFIADPTQGPFAVIDGAISNLVSKLGVDLQKRIYKLKGHTGKIALQAPAVDEATLTNLFTIRKDYQNELDLIAQDIRKAKAVIASKKASSKDKVLAKRALSNLTVQQTSVQTALAQSTQDIVTQQQQLQEDLLQRSNDAYDRRNTKISQDLRKLQATQGDSASTTGIIEQEIESAKDQVKALAPKLKAAHKSGNKSLERSIQAQIDELNTNIVELGHSKLQSIADAFDNFFARVGNAIGRASRIFSALGNTRGQIGIFDQTIAAATVQISVLQSEIASANAAGDTGLAQKLQDQIDELNTTIVETTAQKLQAMVDQVNQDASRSLDQNSLLSRLAANGVNIFQAAGTNANGSGLNIAGLGRTDFGLQGQILQSRGQQLVNQRDALSALAGTAQAQGNIGVYNSLIAQIQSLDGDLVDNTKAIRDNTDAAFDFKINQTNTQGDFTSSINSAGFAILQTLGGAPGGTVDLAAEAANLKLTNSDLGGQLGANKGALGQLLNGLGIDTSQLGSTSDSGLSSYLRQIYKTAVASGNLDDDQLTMTQTLISKILDLTNTIDTNTNTIASLTGALTQSFSSSAWQIFRQAIFNGSGGLLPPYVMPGMASGGRILSDGAIYAHAGEHVLTAAEVNQGQSWNGGGNVYVTAPQTTVQADTEYIGSVVSFKRSRQRAVSP